MADPVIVEDKVHGTPTAGHQQDLPRFAGQGFQFRILPGTYSAEVAQGDDPGMADSIQHAGNSFPFRLFPVGPAIAEQNDVIVHQWMVFKMG